MKPATAFRPEWTEREREIVALLVNGLRNREIGATLGITEQVIKNYMKAIFDKAGCDTRLQLAVLTVERGWLKG